VSTNTEGLLYKFPTVATCLCGETWIHSNDLMTSSCSLIFKNSEELTPRGIQDGFRQMMVLDHIGDLEVFYRNVLILFSVLLCYLEMVITALEINLQMCLCRALSSLTSAMTAFLTSAYRALLAPQRFLRGAIETRVLNRMTLTVSQERLESYIKTDIRMRTRGRGVLTGWFSLTHDEGVPMPVSTMYQVNRLGCALYGAMQLDLEEVAQLLGDNEMFLIFMKIAVFSVLPELDRVPTVRFLETREANTRNVILLGGEESFEGLDETVSQHLDGGGGNIFALSFENILQIILARKGLFVLILRFDLPKHSIIDATRFNQALHKQVGLFFIWIQAVFKCSHRHILLQLIRMYQEPPAGGRQFIPMPEARGPLAAYR
jgi:hypothetical protein